MSSSASKQHVNRVTRSMLNYSSDPGGSAVPIPYNETIIICYDCKLSFDAISLNIDQDLPVSLERLTYIGCRWHCSSCLQNPLPLSSLKQDIKDFKQQMKEKLNTITERFDQQLESFESSIVSKFDVVNESSNKVNKSLSTYAEKLSIGLNDQGKNRRSSI